MAIACIWRNASPTIGIHSNSRLSTQTWRGNTTIMAMVSHDEECFHRATWQPAGTAAPRGPVEALLVVGDHGHDGGVPTPGLGAQARVAVDSNGRACVAPDARDCHRPQGGTF